MDAKPALYERCYVFPPGPDSLLVDRYNGRSQRGKVRFVEHDHRLGNTGILFHFLFTPAGLESNHLREYIGKLRIIIDRPLVSVHYLHAKRHRPGHLAFEDRYTGKSAGHHLDKRRGIFLMETIILEITFYIVHVHLLHGTGLVSCTVEKETVIADHPARELLGVIKNNTFELAPVRQRRDIGEFREK